MMFCLTRTGSASDRPQQALTLLLLDMKAPGVSVRRLRTLDGGEDLNEVTLDGVRVPVANRVGAEGEGWTYAKYLLSFERGGIAGVGSAKKLLQRLGALDAGSPGGRAAVRVLRDDVHRMRVEVLALEATANRLLTQLPSDPTTPSILKVRGTELRQELSRLILQHGQAADICSAVAGAGTSSAGGPPKPNPALAFLDMRKLSIYGGTNEIQRNIIAKQIFRD